MTCVQDTFLLAEAEDCLPTLSLDTPQSLPLSGSHTPAKSCANEPQTDGFQTCECTREMFGCSTHPNTPEAWIASMRASLARTCLTLENRPDLEKALGAGFTAKSCESLASFDRDTSSWKMSQQSLLMDSEPSLETWPRWGMTLDGVAYEHPMSALRITATGGGACVPDGMMFHHTPNTAGMDGGSNSRRALKKRQQWPTPSANNFEQQDIAAMLARRERVKKSSGNGNGFGLTLGNAVLMFPTPCASDNRDRGNMSDPSIQRRIAIGKQIGLSTMVKPETASGSLNPTWVEWLMGWPLTWTNTKNYKAGGKSSRKSAESPRDVSTEPQSSSASEMDKCPCKPQSLGNC